MDQRADAPPGNTFAPEVQPVTLEEALGGPGAPVVVFDHVSLAFDETVVLKDVSFTLHRGPHEDHPRRRAARGSPPS